MRKQALNRDHHTCQIGGANCTGTATEVDHIIPDWRGGSNRLDNLRAVCTVCHKAKSNRERLDAIAYRKQRRKLPKETPPGLIIPGK